jgi:hypothetical protein
VMLTVALIVIDPGRGRWRAYPAGVSPASLITPPIVVSRDMRG